MLQLLSRQAILQLNKTFISYIVKWQDVQYNFAHEHNKYEPGVYIVDVEKDEEKYVSQEECDQWNEEAIKDYNRKKDNVPTIPIDEYYTGTIIYNFPEAAVDDYVDNLSTGIERLTTALNWEAVIFLLDYPVPWLYQNNDYKPVKDALNYLRSIGVTEEFVGGFKANGEELKQLVTHLFWIIRCNAALPYCWFSAVEKEFVGKICKYGNLHLDFYSLQQQTALQNKAEEMGLKQIDTCYENFSETGAIEGRQTIF